MPIFENLGKTLTGAAQQAAKKSGEIVEITKLNMNMGNEENKIEELEIQIGKRVYENFSDGKELSLADFQDICNEIAEHNKNLMEYKNKILEIRNLKLCPSCGTELDKTVQYCNKCGTKQEIIVEKEPDAPVQSVCPKCGAEIVGDIVFCGSCGKKLKEE